MFAPLTKVIVKGFAKEFYRAHSGMLLFFFVIIASYCFFMDTLGHIDPAEKPFYNLILILTFVDNPIITVAVFLFWLFYMVKSWNFVREQLKLPEFQFLFYSSTSLSKSHQFKSWFVFQSIISLPLIIYGFSAIVFGVLFDFYFVPAIILPYLLLLLIISAQFYVRLINHTHDIKAYSFSIKVFKKLPKPFFSLFIYHLFLSAPTTLLVTKVFSWMSLSGLFFLFPDINNDPRFSAIMILLSSTVHAILIFEEHKFDGEYLSCSRNFPYPRRKLFINYIALYLLLFLPETFWLLIHLPIGSFLELLTFGLSCLILFRSILYKTGIRINSYLPIVFGLFILFFLVIMFGLFWVILPCNFLIAYFIFYRSYYQFK